MVPDAEQRKAELIGTNEADGLFKIERGPAHHARRPDPAQDVAGRAAAAVQRADAARCSSSARVRSIAAEDKTITGYDRRRLRLTPGMTGHWQILGSARVPLHEMVKIDYLYVTTWSLFGDIKILARTIPYMLARKGM